MYFEPPKHSAHLNPLKKLASQTAIYGLSQIVGRFVNYLLVPLHTALFDTAEFGVNTLMYSYVTFLNVLLTYGMETAFFRFSQKQDNPSSVYRTAFTSILTSSVFFVLACSLFAGDIASLIKIGNHPEYVRYFILIIALDAVSAIPFAYLRQKNRPVKFAIVKNVNIFTNILLNLYFLLLCPYAQKKYGIILPLYDGSVNVGYIFKANLIASVITIPLLWKEMLAIKEAHFSMGLWKEMMKYGLPLMVVGFAGMINETLDRIVISYIYSDPQEGLRATGIYGANYKLSILMTLFIQAFRYAAEPFFFSHAKSDNKTRIYASVMNYFVVVCLVLFLVVTLYLDVFKHFIDSRFWSGLNVVPILLLANMFLGIYYNLTIWYKLSDNTNKGAVISLSGAIITVVANLVLVPVMGYTGSAWATFICYSAMMVICYLAGAKYFPIPYQVGRIFLYIILAVAIYYFSSLWVTADTTIRWGLSGVAILFFGLTTLWLERKNPLHKA